MKLVVGLGNPGRKYQQTRHNVGFDVVAQLGRTCGDGKPKQNFQGESLDAHVGGQRALLLCPHTYMNLSGGSVLAARDFYKISNEDLLIVCDDFNLPLGKLRFRSQGSAGGQKGLADTIRRLGVDKFSRLRIGVGQPPDRFDPADWVLSRFGKHEQAEIDTAIAIAADAVAHWAREGIESAMNQYNA
jgi:PTH1 family peptidyl-tRNA hydrolase